MAAIKRSLEDLAAHEREFHREKLRDLKRPQALKT